ncbi:MAG TPA: hypothetical protein VJ165_03385 [candidate division Zixibacteria bacterium]|nr:hypothetical protein [candidate division Zixibacteria bacterium]
MIAVTILIIVSTYATSLADLEVKITPLKTTYLLLEPILIHYQVKNVGPDSVQFNKDEVINGFSVMDSKNSTDFIYGRYEISYLRHSPGRHPTLKSGEIVEGTLQLECEKKGSTSSSTTLNLPVEKYRVSLEVSFDKDKRSKSNTTDFEIVEPSGKEKQAYDELLVADSLKRLKNFEAESQKLVDISRKYPTSVYAQPSLQSALITLRYLYAGEYKSELADLSREFIDKYPNSRYNIHRC